MKSTVLGFVFLGCSAQDLFLEKVVPLLKQTFSCDVACIKDEGRREGAGIIASFANLKYSMEVVFKDASSDSGDACGKKNLQFPPYHVTANPSLGVKTTTANTRLEPSIVFECQPGKNYHLLMADNLGGPFQNKKNFNHWLKLNLVCGQNGQAEVQNNGRDMVVNSDLQIKGYLPPAFPYNVEHQFGFFIYETATPFTNAELNQIDKDFVAHNPLGGAYLVEEVASKILKFTSPPVARNWIEVTTDYWSAVRWGRVVPYYPQLAETDFYKLICPCNYEIETGQYFNPACSV